MMDMKAFMKEELKTGGTMEFPGIERFKDSKGNVIPFIIKKLSAAETREIRLRHKKKEVFRDKKNGNRPVISANGRVAMIEEYDQYLAGQELMVEAFVQPKLDDKDLMEYYGVYDRLEMPQVIFSNNEDFQYADDCLMIALGLKEKKSDNEKVEELKK